LWIVEESATVAWMLFSISFGDEHLDCLSEHLLALVRKQPFRLCIYHHDSALLINNDHGVWRGLEQSSELRLGALTFGHVAGDFGKASQCTAAVPDDFNHNVGPESRAVLPHPPAFVFRPSFGGRYVECSLRFAALDIVAGVEAREVPSNDFILSVALVKFRDSVPIQNIAMRIKHDRDVI